MTLAEENRTDPPGDIDFAHVTPTNDVFVVLDSGWHATCECGLEVMVDSQADGWEWLLNHVCAPPE